MRGDAGEAGGWLELSPGALRIVPRVGGVKSVEPFDLRDGRLTFSKVEWFGKWERVVYTLDLQNANLTGTAAREFGPVMRVTGVRAPALDRRATAQRSQIEISHLTDLHYGSKGFQQAGQSSDFYRR